MSDSFAFLLDQFFYRPDEAAEPQWHWSGEEAAPALVAEEPWEEFLAFVLESETYAIPIGEVREILKVSDVTEIPRGPRHLLGLINVRGDMLPLYDVKVHLRLSQTVPVIRGPRDVPRGTRMVLIRNRQGDAGIVVDRVLGVVPLRVSQLEEAPQVGSPQSAITGLGRRDGQLFILFDVERALS